jgi:nitrite reductase/ring-hydroxylating ferredoxin subunit
MPEFVRVCRVDELSPGQVKLAEADRTKLAICNVDGKIFALSNFCPHLTGNLSEGKLEEDELICPEHGWRFRVSTGRCTNVRGKNAHAFPVQIEDGWVLVGV